MRPLLLITVFLLSLYSSQQAQWIEANGLRGWSVRCLTAVSYSNGDTDLVVGTNAGAFVSTNCGSSWTKTQDVLAGKEPRHIGESVSNSIYSLASQGEYLIAGSFYEGIFISTNKGQSWTQPSDLFRNKPVWTIAVNGPDIFAGVEGEGVYVSYDKGKTWMAINNGLTDPYVRALTFSGSYLFAGTVYGGIYRSSDFGKNWTQVNNGLTKISVNTFAVVDSIIYAGTVYDGVFKSTDNGNKWTKVSAGLTDNYIRTLAVMGSDILAGTDEGGIFISTNNGNSWTPVNSGLSRLKIRRLAVIGTKLFAGIWDSGVFMSVNKGADWVPVNSGLTDGFPEISCTSLLTTGSNIFAGTMWGIWRSTDNGERWNKVNEGLTNTDITTIKSVDSLLFAGTWGGGLFFSTSNGAKWTPLNDGLSDLHIRDFASDGMYYYVGTVGSGVFKSHNQGVNWYPMNYNLSNLNINSLVFVGPDLFAGTQKGVFKLRYNSQEWTKVDIGILEPNVRILLSRGTILYAAIEDNGIYKSADSSKIFWIANNTNLPIYNIRALTNSGSAIFAGFYTYGIYMSSDNGQNWVSIDAGHPNLSYVEKLAANDNYIFAGTPWGNGIFKRPFSDIITSIEKKSEKLPIDFSLMQNYPNPFNPSTTIKFSLPHSAYVNITVYNSLGQKVTELISKDMNAGVYTTDWNASGYSSGIYYYRMTAGKYSESKKFILLK